MTDFELDALLSAARSRFLARSDASFDFDAGLADAYRRAAMAKGHAENQAEQQRRARRRRGDGGQPRHRSAGGS